jgi:tetratricopeptide (TPR) repeat protein
MPPPTDPRKEHRRHLEAVARSLNGLITLLEQRGKHEDPAWHAKWLNAVSDHHERFQSYLDLKKERKLDDVVPIRGQWYRLFNLDPSGHHNATKYLLQAGKATPASFVGLNFEQVHEASWILVEYFKYGTEKLLPKLGDEASWSAVFDYAVGQLQAELGLNSSTGSTRIFNIPIRVPIHFMGRDHEIAALDTALDSSEGRAAITTLRGLRGVGKTVLAAAYAEKHRTSFDVIWWVRADTEPTLKADLAALGVRLGWAGTGATQEDAIAMVMERLPDASERILLIFDNARNANALNPYLPRGGPSKILITSNSHAWRGTATPIEIRVWPAKLGGEFLMLRSGREQERGSAEKLSEILSGLPLALEQAGAYCEYLDVSLPEYLKRYEGAHALLLDDSRYAPSQYYDGLSVAKTFALAIQEACNLHSAAKMFMTHIALLAPEPIPLYVFSEGYEQFPKLLASALRNGELEAIIAALRTFALVEREAIADEYDPNVKTESIRIHRLVRDIALAGTATALQAAFRRALIKSLAIVYPPAVHGDATTWPRARRLDALAVALITDEASLPSGIEEVIANLLSRLGGYRQEALGALDQARPFYERSLEICKATLGEHHRDTAVGYNNLGLLLQNQGDFASARPLLEKALAIQEELLGLEHLDIADTLNNIALVVQQQGDLVGAKPYFERALKLREQFLGEKDYRVAQSLNNLGLLLRPIGDLESALQLCKRALAIFEELFGTDHPGTGLSLNNIGLILQDQGKPSEARPFLERALTIHERIFSAEHLRVAMSLHNLAMVLHDEGDIQRALTLIEKAVPLWAKGYGAEHPNTNRARANYARVLLKVGRAADALEIAQSALAAHHRVLGPKHRATGASARVASEALDALGRGDEAAALRRRHGIQKQ